MENERPIFVISLNYVKRNTMTKPNLWRRRAHVVGYLDIAFTFIFEIARLFGVITMEGIRLEMGGYSWDITRSLPNPEIIVQVASWACLITATILTSFEFLAAVQLIAGTKAGRDPQHAWKLSIYWRKVTTLNLFQVVIPVMLLGSLNALMVNAVVRIAFLGVVDMLIFELRGKLKVEQA